MTFRLSRSGTVGVGVLLFCAASLLLLGIWYVDANSNQRLAVDAFYRQEASYAQAAAKFAALPGTESLAFGNEIVFRNGFRIRTAAGSDISSLSAENAASWIETAKRLNLSLIEWEGRTLSSEARYISFLLNIERLPHHGFIYVPIGSDYAYFRLQVEINRKSAAPLPSVYSKIIAVAPRWFYFEENSLDKSDQGLLEQVHGHPRSDEEKGL